MRASHYFLAKFWAGELAKSEAKFGEIYQKFEANESEILSALNAGQGKSVDFGGYFKFDREKAKKIMCPSEIFNQILGEF